MLANPFNRQLLNLFADELTDRCSEAEVLILELEASPEDARRSEIILNLFRLCHSMKGAASFVGVKPIEIVCHWLEDNFEAARSGGQLPTQFIENALEIIDAVSQTAQIILRGDDFHKGPISRFLKTTPNGEEFKSPEIEQTNTELHNGVPMPPIRTSDVDGSVRIPFNKLDELLYRSEELIITKLRLRDRTREIAELLEAGRQYRINNEPGVSVVQVDDLNRFDRMVRTIASNLEHDLKYLETATDMLESEVRNVVMQPFSVVCGGLFRVVRDLGLGLEKKTKLVVIGEDTQIDRSILGGLHDALRHLVRNAMDHGIESPAARRALGKPSTGCITISAKVSGDRLKVTVKDDGAGLDPDRLRQRASELGLSIGEDERDAHLSVFNPGFSTARTITQVSGRGLGLDIVKSAVERMRGFIDVTSVKNEGTTFTLALPLSLTSTRAIIVTAGNKKFAIDAAAIRRIVDHDPTKVLHRGERSFYAYDHGNIPYLDLTRWMKVIRRTEGKGFGIIMGTSEHETMICVENILSDHEILLRPLGHRLSGLRHYDGATILPSGEVVLVLNIASLLETASAQSRVQIDHPRYHRKRILVADDSSSTRAVQKVLLEEDGYEVMLAADGSEAWDILGTHRIDAVVADVDMPNMDGFALTRCIRTSPRHRNLPVILVSARSRDSDIEEGLNAGANTYLTKSTFEHKKLLSELRKRDI